MVATAAVLPESGPHHGSGASSLTAITAGPLAQSSLHNGDPSSDGIHSEGCNDEATAFNRSSPTLHQGGVPSPRWITSTTPALGIDNIVGRGPLDVGPVDVMERSTEESPQSEEAVPCARLFMPSAAFDWSHSELPSCRRDNSEDGAPKLAVFPPSCLFAVGPQASSTPSSSTEISAPDPCMFPSIVESWGTEEGNTLNGTLTSIVARTQE